MHTKSILVLAVAAASPALAFTNGSLVPAYICNPKSDGLPKSFGQLLQFTREKTPAIAFNKNAGQNVKAPQLQQQNGQQIGNSAYILASMHDSPNNIQVQQQNLKVKANGGQTIQAGQANQLTITTSANNAQLKGLLIYGRDASSTPQGGFTDKSGQNIFVDFPGCGTDAQGQVSGVIQQNGVSATNSFSSLFYNAPACIPNGNLTLGGLSVTSTGFGIWSYNFQVTGSKCGSGNSASSGSASGSGDSAASGSASGSGNNASSGSSSGSGAAASASVAAAAAPSPSPSTAAVAAASSASSPNSNTANTPSSGNSTGGSAASGSGARRHRGRKGKSGKDCNQ